MAPAPASSLFLAKVIANFLFVSLVQVILAPLFAIFYNLHPLGEKWLLLVVLPLGTWALVVNGTFFAALSIRTRNRELLLPLLLFPIFVPALLGMVEATTAILIGDSDPRALDQAAGGLRRYLHHGKPAALFNRAGR